jgi:hypothetical protein
MKKIYVSLIASTLLILLAFNACRKPHKPETPIDPCANKKLVTALQEENYACAHFAMEGQQGLDIWLRAINWNDYSDKVIPGKKYRIAYQEVTCPKEGCDVIDPGFGIGEMKCISITCLELAEINDCLGSVMNPDKFNEQFSNSIRGLKVNGDAFKIQVGFSGCDRAAIKNFKLALRFTMARCPDNNNRMFLAKVLSPDIQTCQAYFQEEVCFDLSQLRNYMVAEAYDMSQPVTIRLQNTGGAETDFTYLP